MSMRSRPHRHGVAKMTAGLVVSVAITGCFSGIPLPVSATYMPEPDVQQVTGAESVKVAVQVNDTRDDKMRVRDFNASMFGQSFANRPILTNDDLDRVVQSGVESELKDRGFELAPTGKLVAIDLEKVEVSRFRSQSLLDSSEDGAAAVIVMMVRLKRSDGTVTYSKQVGAKSVLFGLEDQTLSSGSQQALNYALDKAVRNLMAEPGFIKALKAPAPLPIKPRVPSGLTTRAETGRSPSLKD
jgi:hypothetical protein